MSELWIQSLTMPAVKLDADNPLPPLEVHQIPTGLKYPPDLPADMVENMTYGHISSILPYTIQDGFNRQLEQIEFKAAVLENDVLRATFLLEYGGRLWSLIHKPTHRELLEVNPVFQLANLAVRKAWFSGGVEWNIGTTGHSPHTCAPVFSCGLEGEDGTPILRLYEWERLRQVPYQIDAFLPDGSPVLFIQVRILNPNKGQVPIYWWSNIAVPEIDEMRVLVPAESAYCLGCELDQLTRVPVPEFNGIDFTYSTNVWQAADFFFDIPDDQQPWIAALDGEGQGLVHVSTKRLKGRKLWVWGRSPGGRNWQKFLSPPGRGYIEIQAGLTRTQLEHQRMPAGEAWSWLEAYGLLEADPHIVHGSDWQHAWQHAEGELQKLISFAQLAEQHQRGAGFVNASPCEFYHYGSGWGVLEKHLREAVDRQPFILPGLVFGDEALTTEQSAWIHLLKFGKFPVADPKSPPIGFVVDTQWGDILEKSLGSKNTENWLAWYHAGLIRYQAGDQIGAQRAWQESLELNWSPWAARNLAIIAWNEGRLDTAADYLIDAFHAAPDILPLAIECGRCLVETGRFRVWLNLVQEMTDMWRANGRIRLLEAQAALSEGKLEVVEKFFKDEVVIADLREGEGSLTELWFYYHACQLSIQEKLPLDEVLIERVKAQVSVPINIDFRVKSGIGVGNG
jgi:tetratricopeptide (TPR) repeat protein